MCFEHLFADLGPKKGKLPLKIRNSKKGKSPSFSPRVQQLSPVPPGHTNVYRHTYIKKTWGNQSETKMSHHPRTGEKTIRPRKNTLVILIVLVSKG